MIFLSTKGFEYKVQKLSCWHYWFAWHPVAVHYYPDGAKKIVWLQKVLRKMTLVGWYPDGPDWKREYKLI